MTKLKTASSRVTEPVQSESGHELHSLACRHASAEGFGGRDIEVALEQQPRFADGSIGPWERVRTFRQNFEGRLPLAVGSFRFEFSQPSEDAIEREWDIVVRDGAGKLVELAWFDHEAARMRRSIAEGTDVAEVKEVAKGKEDHGRKLA